MRVLFGRIDYVFAKVDREHPAEKAVNGRRSISEASEAEQEAFRAYHGGLLDAVGQRANGIDATERLSLAMTPTHTVMEDPDGPGLMGGYLSKVLTGKDAKAVLAKLGIRVSCRDSKQVNDGKILAGLRTLGNGSEEAGFSVLEEAVDGYTQLHEAAGGSVNRINVTV